MDGFYNLECQIEMIANLI